MPSSTPLATQTAALLFRLGLDPARVAGEVDGEFLVGNEGRRSRR